MDRDPIGGAILIALVALVALSFLAGTGYGWMLIPIGLIALVLRKGSRAQGPEQHRSRPQHPRDRRPRPPYEPYDPEDFEEDLDDHDAWDGDDDSEWDEDDGEWDWDDTEPPRRSSRSRHRRSESWETDDADYI